jgi:RHS repeat-associated protein
VKTIKILFTAVVVVLGFGVFNTAISHISTPPLPPLFPPPPPPCGGGSSGGGAQCCPSGSNHKVVYFTGQENIRMRDMMVDGVFPITITREYNSHSDYDSPLGYGWAFKHDFALYEYPDNSVIVRHGCGNRDNYIFTAGAYQTQPGNLDAALTKEADDSFVLTFLNGARYTYDIQGRLTAVFDVRGNSHEYIYDARGKLPLTGSSAFSIDKSKPLTVAYNNRVTRVQERLVDGSLSGHYIDFAYSETTGRVLTITSNDGRVVNYQHDVVTGGLTEGNLVNVNGLDGHVSTYLYEDTVGAVYQDRHNITSYQHGAAATPVELTYDSSGRVTLETYGNESLSFNWSNYLFETVVTRTRTDALGNNPQTSVEKYQFDGTGFITSKEDAQGNSTVYTLNVDGRIEKEEFFEQLGTTAVPNLVLAREINRTYRADGAKQSELITLQSGEVVSYVWTYDVGRITSAEVSSSNNPGKVFRTEWVYNHDAKGNPVSIREIRRKQNNADFLVTAYTYNTNGDVLTETYPDNHVVEYEYGAAYNGLYVTKKSHQGFGVQQQEVYEYDAQGNMSKVTDAKNHSLTVEYDDLGQPLKMTNDLGHVTAYQYDNRGNLTSITEDRTAANDQLDIFKMTYDGKDQLQQVERTDNTGAFVLLESNKHDSAGNIISKTNSLNQTATYQYDSRDRLAGITNHRNETVILERDALDNVTNLEVRNSSAQIVTQVVATYDALGRQLTEVGASNNQTTSFAYDAVGNLVSTTDALNRPTTHFNTDLLGQLLSTQDANGELTQYAFNDRGWPESITDPRSIQTVYNYNPLGDIDNIVSPDAGITVMTYDNAGNNRTRRDARNITSTYSYDPLDRLTGIVYPDTTKNITYTYDQGTNGLGYLSTLTDNSGSSAYEFSIWGDLSKETKIVNGQSFVVEYSYDTEQRLASVTYPSGRVISFGYNANQEVTSIESNYQSTATTLINQITYEPFFKGLDQLTFGNGLNLNMTYDLDYRLTRQQLGSLYDKTIAYNDVDNITAITNNLDAGRNQTFIYDFLNRLTDSTGIVGSEHFEYDDAGNRLLDTLNGAATSNYAYDLTSNQLSNITGADVNSFTYDAIGNTKQTANIVFSYDDANRLIQAVNGAVTANYTYDGNGQRVSKQVAGDTTLFIYDQEGKLIAEHDGSGAVLREYVYLGTLPVAMIKYGTNAGTYYYHNDHLGTPQFLTNQSQNVVWAADYKSFGDAALLTATIENPMRFPGQYFDAETGLQYNYFRYYDPALGRYISSDPIGQAGGSNTYSYVNGNPLSLTDPNGLSPFSALAKYLVKQGMKGGMRKFAKQKIQKRLWGHMNAQQRKQFLKDLEKILDTLDSSWWETCIDLIPGVGDLYGAGKLAQKARKLYDLMQDLENRYVGKIAKSLGDTPAGKSFMKKMRRAGVNDAKTDTRNKNKQLGTNDQYKGKDGHHGDSVADNPDRASDPRNIDFMNRQDHFQCHNCNWQNQTSSPGNIYRN